MNPTFYRITVCQIITLFGNAALRFALPLYLLRRIDSVVAHCLFFYHHPSVGVADSSPQWEPYETPLLEERWHALTEWRQKRTSWCRPFSHTH